MGIIKRAAVALTGGLVALGTGLTAQAAVIVASPDDLTDLEVGEAFSIMVATDDAQGAFDGFQFDLTFDADIVGFTGVAFGDDFTFTGDGIRPSSDAGVITVTNITGGIFDPTGTGLSGARTLATLSFVVRDEGMTDITISPTAGFFLSLLGQEVPGGGTFALQAVVPSDDVMDPVPVPGALVLFAPALLGLRGLRRRA